MDTPSKHPPPRHSKRAAFWLCAYLLLILVLVAFPRWHGGQLETLGCPWTSVELWPWRITLAATPTEYRKAYDKVWEYYIAPRSQRVAWHDGDLWLKIGYARFWRISVWAIGGNALLACAVVGLAHGARRWQLRCRERRRPDRCRQCGYDLTGNVSGVCPECGTHVRTQVSNAPTK
ncbi:MAG: hypothetical protein AB1716_07740 [Planctomycetota bacterium]